MKQFTTRGIVLKRLNYQEADRLVTVLTADHGKLTLMAKGVRKIKSKLAGGIELLTVNEMVIIEGKGDIYTLRSARMQRNFAHLSSDYGRMQLGFQLLKLVQHITESQLEPAYFEMVELTLANLDDPTVQPIVTQLWYLLNFLRLQGRQPNFTSDVEGGKLMPNETYSYLPDEGSLRKGGLLGADHIKLARLCLQLLPKQLMQIKNVDLLALDWLKQLRMFDPV